MASFRGQDSWAKMTSSGGRPTPLANHPTEKVNKAEELTYLTTNIGLALEKKSWQCRTAVPGSQVMGCPKNCLAVTMTELRTRRAAVTLL
jgi:hypothetical protein